MAVPARLKAAPRLLLEHAASVVDGDWSRVTFENGSLTIHNVAPKAKPPAPRLVKPAGKTAPKKRTVKKTAAKRATAKKTAPPVPRPAPPPPRPTPPAAPAEPLNRDPSAMAPEFVEKVYDQKFVERRATPRPPVELPKHLAAPPVHVRRTPDAPEPVTVVEPPKLRPTIKDKLSDAERAAAQAMRQPVPKFDRPVPPEFRITEAWEQLDVDRVATSILNVCRKGLPEVLPLDMHPDVLALEGINFDLVVSSVRNPHYVEIAGLETETKGYPVLRFFRGDITTVVGLREAMFPRIIATYAISTLMHDIHRTNSNRGVGGGGARKASGLPRTSAAVQKRLSGLGATIKYDELRDKTATVIYREQDLGKIALQGSRQQCETDYQRMIRKMEAISRRG